MAAKIGGILIDVAADVSKLIEGMNKAQATVDKNVAMIKKSLGPLAGMFAGIVSINAMKNIIDTADAMGEQAQKLALSSEAWSKYAYVAKFAGVEVSTLESGLSKLIANVNDFTRDGGGGAAKAFEELGISASFAKENFTSTEKTFDIIVSKLQSMGDGYKKTALVQEIFGKGAGDLVRYTDLGADGIERLGKQAEITGNIISQDFANNAGELNDGLDTLGSISTGVGNKIMTVFTPALVEASRAVSDFLNIQRQMSAFELNQKIAETSKHIKDLENDLKTISLGDKLFGNSEDGKTSAELRAAKNNLNAYTEQLEQTLKVEEKIAKQKEDSFNAGKNQVNEENEAKKRIESLKKYSDEKLKQEEEFNNKYKQATMSNYDYKVSLLDDEKQKHLNNKMSAIKVEEWYQSELKKLNDEKTKLEEENNNKVLENQKEFNNEYNRTILNRFEYERTLLDQQKLDWKKQGQDEIKIAEMYSEKSKQIASDEAEYFKKTEQEKREASNDWHMGMEDAIKDYQDRVNDNYAQSKQFFTRTLDGMTDSLANFVIEGKASFSDFARSLGADLAKIIIQKQMAGIVGNLFDNSGISTAFNSIFASAHGNVFDGGHDVAFATGGVVGSPTYFPMTNGKTGLMGEAGPEAIIPLSRIGNDLGVKSVPSNVVLNISNNTSSEITANKINDFTRINERGESEKVLTIVIDGVSRNTLGMRDMIKGLK